MAEKTERDEMFLAAFMACWEIHKENKEPSELMISVYSKALEKYTGEQIQDAFTRAIMTLKWFPKPVELIDIITGGPQGIEDKALSEALIVLKTIKRVGGYNSVVFDDKITACVIQDGFGGWAKICQELLEENEKWFIRDFQSMYKSFARSGRKFDGKLLGFVESKNIERGYSGFSQDAVMISGDKQKLIGG